jgi:alpha-muurolene/germacrene-A/gamma-muurolene synthase
MSPLSQDVATKPSTSFIIPDLVSHCNFPLSYNVHGDEVARESVDWLDVNCPDLNVKQRRDLRGLQAGELTAYCYHTASRERLRVVSDFMNYLFHLCDFLRNVMTSIHLISLFPRRDNISDGMMTRETDVLADVVMNALWFTDKYMPTNSVGKVQPKVELNPGKLARE